MRASELIPLIAKKCEMWITGGRYGSVGGSFFGYSGEETEREMAQNRDALVRNIWHVGSAVRIICFDFPNMSEWDRKRRVARPKELLLKLEGWEKRYGETFLSEEGRRRLNAYKEETK